MSKAEPSGQANKAQPSRQANDSEVEFERWYKSTDTMLGCLRNQYVQASSISFVPEQLKKSEAEAYTPRVVSIGPLHRGTRTDLLHMEDIKWRYMEYLLRRTEDAVESLKTCSNMQWPSMANLRRTKLAKSRSSSRECSEAILNLDEIVRASYNVVDIKLNRYELAKIMLLDGCFLLELLIRGSPKVDRKLKGGRNKHSHEAEVRKREVVLSDLTLLENQIPFIILVELVVKLFPGVLSAEKDEKKNAKKIWEDKLTSAGKEIKRAVLSLFGYSPDSKIYNIQNPAHVLEVVHSYITKEIQELEDKTKHIQEHEDVTKDIQEHEEKKEESVQVKNTHEKDAKKDEKKNALKIWEDKLASAGKEIKKAVLSLFGYSSNSKIDNIQNPALVSVEVHSLTQETQEQEEKKEESVQVENTNETRTSGIHEDNAELGEGKHASVDQFILYSAQENMRQKKDHNSDVQVDKPREATATENKEKNKNQETKAEKSSVEVLKLKYCATTLEAAGVTIKAPKDATERSKKDTAGTMRFDLRIRFSEKRELEIPPLHITKTTEAKWRNFIAWELDRSDRAETIDLDQERRTRCLFICYALFFKGLICSVHDVQLLRNKNVILVDDVNSSNLQDRKGKEEKIMSNEDVMNLFRKITEGIPEDQVITDSYFSKVFQCLNSCPLSGHCIPYTLGFNWHCFRWLLTEIWYFFRTSLMILIRDHITSRWKLITVIAASMTFLFTFLEKFF